MKKTITLQKLSLLNFKGIRNKTLEFQGNTFIYGDNATGKSTLFDAFTWLLFGKDSTDRTDFELKTLDKYNQVIPKIEHEVEGTIKVNESTIVLKRILREKWQKPRGQSEAVFNGNETLYYWNDVPMKAKEYQAKIESIIPENIFRLLTNPMAFNNLSWQDRRAVLIEMFGDVSDEELAKENPDYAALSKILKDKSLVEYKREMAAKRKRLKDDLKLIPTRIDEVVKGKPEPVDFAAIEAEKQTKVEALQKVESQIEDKSKLLDQYFEEKNAHSRKVHNKKSELADFVLTIERSFRKAPVDESKLDSLKTRLRLKELDLNDTVNGIKKLQAQQSQIESERNEKRNQWHEVNSKELVMDDENFKCPTCERAFEAEDIEKKKQELKEKFISGKQRELDRIQQEGVALKQTFEKNEELLKESLEFEENLRKTINQTNEEISEEQQRIDAAKANTEKVDLEAELAKNKEYQAMLKEIEELEASAPVEQKVDTEALKAEKSQINAEITELNRQLNQKEAIEKADARVKELEAEEDQLADQLLEIEKQEFEAESFEKLKIETLERKINSHFKMVNFKMFSEQINGGISETCEALIDGVPFSNANTASKVNAGLDIINSLCEYYRATAPVFLDNRESVVHLVETQSQVINLVVSEKDKKLRIEAVEPEMAV